MNGDQSEEPFWSSKSEKNLYSILQNAYMISEEVLYKRFDLKDVAVYSHAQEQKSLLNDSSSELQQSPKLTGKRVNVNPNNS